MSNSNLSRRYTQIDNGTFLAIVYQPNGHTYTIEGFKKRYAAYQAAKKATMVEYQNANA